MVLKQFDNELYVRLEKYKELEKEYAEYRKEATLSATEAKELVAMVEQLSVLLKTRKELKDGSLDEG